MYTVAILWNDITLPENYEAFLREPVAIQVAGYEPRFDGIRIPGVSCTLEFSCF